MTNQNAKLLEILKIGHDCSMRGEGISLQEALRRTQYANIRPNFSPKDLLPIIKDHSNLIEEWLLYSYDKRTLVGWYLLEEGEVGQVNKPESRKHFDSLDKAVAEYVVLELDCWVAIREKD